MRIFKSYLWIRQEFLTLLWRIFIIISIITSGLQSADAINYKPVVDPGQIVKTVLEDSKPGVEVAYLKSIATDTENDKITFSIDPVGGQICNIDKETGNITLKTILDREITDKYKFSAFAEDDYQGGGVNRRTAVTIFLYVLDVNDNSPFFEGTPYIKSVPENISLNSLVLTVTASDRDEGRNADVTYKFKNGTSMNKFTIDSINGEVRVAGELDYERVQRHTLVVIATDYGENPLSSQTTLIIDVQDVSDSKPRFLLSSYQGELLENSPKGTEIVRVAAIDGDIGINNPINYEFYSGNIGNLFKINKVYGNITVNGVFDRENGSLYSLKIKGYEVPDPTSYTLVDVIVFIKDVNDHKPTFKHDHYTIKLNENTPKGYVIIDRMDATDGDVLPVNNRILYSMSGDIGPFELKEDTGQLTVKGPLDYEKKATYSLTVKATEKSTAEKYYGTTTVVIELLNVNDHGPVFPQSEYNFTIKEDVEVGSVVGRVVASDDDKGAFGQVTYEITGGKANVFRINGSNGEISTTAILDFETTASHHLIVFGKDQAGIYTKTTSVVVNIFLEDVNDNAPQFVALPTEITVAEEGSIGIIFTLKAKDPDTGTNGEIFFELLNTSIPEFGVESTTGNINNVMPLDHERRTEYTLALKATDRGAPPQSITSYLTVKVKDINDNRPIFNQSSYSARLDEVTPIGTLVMKIHASDADSGLNSLVSYSIYSGNEDNLFHINAAGQITTRNNLDRETKAFYSLIVVAADSGTPRRSSNVTVDFLIQDANDNFPLFEKARYHLNVNESEAVGTKLITVKAEDRDEGYNANITYRITTGNQEGKFRINPKLGDVILNGSLDWETTIVYILVVEARDGGIKSNARTALLTIEVQDSNDNPPVFREKYYYFQIFENSPLQASLGLVWADDKDGRIPPNKNGIVTYKITAGNLNETFEIDSKFGTLRTKAKLDKEEISSYNLTVTAVDLGVPPLSSSVPVYIEIIDLNDNTPQFEKPEYMVNITEDEAVGTSIIKVHAKDIDSGLNGLVKYSISGGNTLNMFAIDNNGLITTTKYLDRETNDRFILSVTAFDSAASKQSTTVKVTINVLDVNDNAPIFHNNFYTVSVQEEKKAGQVVVKIAAVDKDIGDNGKLTYSILTATPENSFDISNSGEITTTAVLDREKFPKYTLNISVSDEGIPSFSAWTVVSVTVLDVNDYPPVISNLPATVNVKEDIGGGESILTVLANDKDQGRNKKLLFFIVSGSFGKFIIDENTGVVRTSPSRFDRETMEVFNLTINVTDSGLPLLWSSSYLIVKVDDVNDNAPQFIPNPELFPGVYTCRIKEGRESVGKDIFDANATDADKGQNAMVQYHLIASESSEYFTIDKTTGVITVSKPLDREGNRMVLDSYGLGKIEITIKASDSAEKTPKYSLAKITIYVTDVNDNVPVFTSSKYIGSVTEGSKITQDIVQVAATDADLGYNARIQYSITSGNIGGVFAIIDPFIGKISVARLLNTEDRSNYSLTVQARDDASVIGGISLSSTTQVEIYVGDINDNDPVFEELSYATSILENAKIGAEIIRVIAVDKDQGDNGKVSYSIEDGNLGNKFKMSSSNGTIYLIDNIDREKKASYLLTIKAEDKGFPSPRKSLTTLKVTVLDVNDNAPSFRLSVYQGHVKENSEKGTIVTMEPLYATDMDSGVNSKIAYFITGSDVFQINSSSGIITTKVNNLDRELKPKYEFKVFAVDTGGLNSSAEVHITLDDVNDNSPVFPQDEYNVTVSESTSVGYQIARIVATDKDIDVNAELIYQLTGGEGKFYIDRTEGAIRLNSKLDRETKKEFSAVITASDTGKPSKEGSTRVNFFVLDVLDTAPIFSPSVVSIRVLENTTINSVIYVAKAIDTDVDDTLKYSIIQQSSDAQFSIDIQSGAVLSKKLLDRENTSSYFLYIRATDSVGLTSKNQDLKLEIEIIDVNDNAPQFLRKYYKTEIIESTPNGAILLTVQALDRDIGKNAIVQYSFVEDMSTILGMDNSLGLVKKTGNFLRGTNRVMNFSIRASDAGHPPQSTVVPCTIVWVAVNADSPKFDSPQYFAAIAENADIGASVLQVNATEQDTGRNGKITYYLVEPQGTFDIDQHTGKVTVGKRLDREIQHTYSMTVTAKDDGIPPKQGMSSLTINIFDINDNTPRFSAVSYSFSIYEGPTAVKIVGSVEATDKDAGNNSKITYAILDGNFQNWFSVDAENGTIKTTTSVDREVRSSVKLSIKATDSGVSPLSSVVKVTINILDKNDNSPNFSSNVYTATIEEDAFGGKQILTVTAKDPDLGSNSDITYTIISGNYETTFAIGAKTGAITIAKSLNYEERSIFHLIVRASDQGKERRQSTCKVNIFITDVNDNTPRFSKTKYIFRVYETAEKNTYLGNVSAVDDDLTPQHRMIYYEIKEGNDDNTFHIKSSTGQLYLNRMVDREKKASYSLTVTAYNRDKNGNKVMASDTLTVVDILDVNDNSPFFQPNCCNATISEGAGVGDTILKLSATDEDDGTNKKIEYSIIKGNNLGLFSIIKTTGELKVSKKLNREEKSLHLLVVKASDGGKPVRSANVTVTVHVSDVNDERPVFKSITIPMIPENATIGTSVTTFIATDEDLGKNSEIKYFIISGNVDGSFLLDATTGELKIARSLDYERTSVYHLQIDAVDQGNPPLSTHRKFAVSLLNINDNIPIFLSRNVKAIVAENLPPGSIVAKISATDADEDPIYYNITDGNKEGQFKINTETGVLTTTRVLDREQQELFVIKVTASNEKIRPVTRRKKRAVAIKDSSIKLTSFSENILSTQTILITIADVNDNGPRFTQNEFNGGVSEDAKYASSVMRVQAIDRDTGNSSRLVYFIVDANKDNAFEMEKETGWIKTAVLFSGKTGASYTYKIMVKDNGGKRPYFNHTAYVKLFILTDLQRVVLTMNVVPDDVKNNKAEFKRVLENVTGYIINIDEIQYSTNNGHIDFSASDMLIHAVDPKTNKILNRDVVLKTIDSNYPALSDFFKKWKITSVKAKLSARVEAKSNNTTVILIGIAVGLLLVVIGFAFAIYHLRKRQRRKLKAATASASDSELKQQVNGNEITENGTIQPKVYTIEGVALLEEYNNRDFLSTFQRNGIADTPRDVTEIYLPDVYTDIDVDNDISESDSSSEDEHELKQIDHRAPSRAELLLAASLEGLGTLETDGNLVTAI